MSNSGWVTVDCTRCQRDFRRRSSAAEACFLGADPKGLQLSS